MKLHHLILVAIFLLSSHSSVSGQQMVKEGNRWNVVIQSFFGPNTRTQLYRIGQDTLLDDITYHTIFATGDTTNLNWQLSDKFIREDSTQKIFLKDGNAEETLLYDFGVEVNDTIPFKLGFEDTCLLYVVSIDTVTFYNGAERKRINLGSSAFGDNSGYYWIEGVGSNLGPLFNMYCYFDVEGFLSCFYENDMLQLSNNYSIDCFINPTSNVLPSDIEIYPNPFSDVLNIQFEDTPIVSFQLYDIYGRLIMDHQNANQNIDTSRLNSGTYMIALHTKDGRVYSEKLVKL